MGWARAQNWAQIRRTSTKECFALNLDSQIQAILHLLYLKKKKKKTYFSLETGFIYKCIFLVSRPNVLFFAKRKNKIPHILVYLCFSLKFCNIKIHIEEANSLLLCALAINQGLGSLVFWSFEIWLSLKRGKTKVSFSVSIVEMDFLFFVICEKLIPF